MEKYAFLATLTTAERFNFFKAWFYDFMQREGHEPSFIYAKKIFRKFQGLKPLKKRRRRHMREV